MCSHTFIQNAVGKYSKVFLFFRVFDCFSFCCLTDLFQFPVVGSELWAVNGERVWLVTAAINDGPKPFNIRFAFETNHMHLFDSIWIAQRYQRKCTSYSIFQNNKALFKYQMIWLCARNENAEKKLFHSINEQREIVIEQKNGFFPYITNKSNKSTNLNWWMAYEWTITSNVYPFNNKTYSK